MSEDARTCMSCNGEAHEVRLINENNFGSDSLVEYTVPAVNIPKWSGNFPIAGEIATFMCTSCGHISFFAKPK